jgi:hypothetical protein
MNVGHASSSQPYERIGQELRCGDSGSCCVSSIDSGNSEMMKYRSINVTV